MPDTTKKQDKPNDPPYAGGEDETTRKNSEPGENEPPVDESDDGPAG